MTHEQNQQQKPGQMQKHYWPFEVLAPERQTEQHKCEIRFLETAYKEGYKPYMDSVGNLGTSSSTREAWIVLRGRRRWEIRLWTSSQETLQETLSAFLDDFDCAAETVLQWHRGDDATDILSRAQSHLVMMPGATHSFVLHDQAQTR